jgi:hypothetical protein
VGSLELDLDVYVEPVGLDMTAGAALLVAQPEIQEKVLGRKQGQVRRSGGGRLGWCKRVLPGLRGALASVHWQGVGMCCITVVLAVLNAQSGSRARQRRGRRAK